MESEIKRERKVSGLALGIAFIFPLALQIPTGIGESPPGYDYRAILPIDTSEIWAKATDRYESMVLAIHAILALSEFSWVMPNGMNWSPRFIVYQNQEW